MASLSLIIRIIRSCLHACIVYMWGLYVMQWGDAYAVHVLEGVLYPLICRLLTC